MRRPALRKTVVLQLAAGLSIPLLLTGCSIDSDAPPSTAPSTAPTTAEPSAPETTPTTEAPTATAAKVKMSATTTDDILGDKVDYLEAVRNYQVPQSLLDKPRYKDDGGEFVLVHVKVAAGTKYYAGIDDSTFEWGVPGKDYAANSISPASFPDLAAKMKSDGYAPLERVRTGKSGEGWIVGYFYGSGTHDGAFVAYRRVAAKGSDGSDIPRMTYPVTIPTA